MKKIPALLILFFCACVGAPFSHGAREGLNLDELFPARVRIVGSGADYKVRFEDNFGSADLRLSLISGSPWNEAWQLVSYGEDFTIEIVDSDEDFSVYVL